jgi:drug/metabolite transporter (DMT)-like permease
LTTQQKAYLALIATSILWGTTWVASKLAVQNVPGLQVAGIRQLTAGTLLVGFFLLKGQQLPSLQQFFWLFIMSLLMFVGSNGLATISLKFIPSGLSALIAALYPLSVVLIEMLFFKNNQFSGRTFIGLFLGIGGIALVLYENAFHAHAAGYGWGILTSILSMLTWSVGTIFIARKKLTMNPYNATGWEMLLGSFVLLTLSFATGNHIPLAQVPLQSWLALSYLVSIGSIVAFAAFVYSMKNLPPAIAALYAYINPIVAILVGSVIAGEKLTTIILIGSLITLSGVYLVNQSFKKENKPIQYTDADAI